MTFAERTGRRRWMQRPLPAPKPGANSHARARGSSLPIPNEGELAWQLAAEVTPSLDDEDKTSVYLKLGCGDHFEAIVEVLTLGQRRDLVLSRQLVTLIERWQLGYVGSDCEAAVSSLLNPSRTQRA
jgi:hypothetical protein